MGPIDFLILGIIAAVVAGSVFHIVRSKKKGAKCIGCSGSCCEGCSGRCGSKS